jgi:hypothetical protein
LKDNTDSEPNGLDKLSCKGRACTLRSVSAAADFLPGPLAAGCCLNTSALQSNLFAYMGNSHDHLRRVCCYSIAVHHGRRSHKHRQGKASSLKMRTTVHVMSRDGSLPITNVWTQPNKPAPQDSNTVARSPNRPTHNLAQGGHHECRTAQSMR